MLVIFNYFLIIFTVFIPCLVVSKAASLCYSLVMNHPFVDGNKRVGHAAMETFLILNGMEIDAPIDEQEKIILDLAAGILARKDFSNWLKNRVVHITSG